MFAANDLRPTIGPRPWNLTLTVGESPGCRNGRRHRPLRELAPPEPPSGRRHQNAGVDAGAGGREGEQARADLPPTHRPRRKRPTPEGTTLRRVSLASLDAFSGARSSLGRAPPWHGGGNRFDPGRVHKRQRLERRPYPWADPVGSTKGSAWSADPTHGRRQPVRSRSGPQKGSAWSAAVMEACDPPRGRLRRS
jgi:hypothetical protein